MLARRGRVVGSPEAWVSWESWVVIAGRRASRRRVLWAGAEQLKGTTLARGASVGPFSWRWRGRRALAA
jgi:hypothetical protein